MYAGVCFCAILLVSSGYACEYEAKIEKIETCPGAKNEIEITNPGLILSKDCNILTKGCAQLKKSSKKFVVTYEIYKMPSPMAVLKGTKNACGYQIKNYKFECATKENDNICSQKDWVFEVPQNALKMGATGGKIKAKVTITTDNGSTCIIVIGQLTKK